MSVIAQAERIRTGTLSPVTALAEATDRIARLDPQLSAFICLNEHARTQAEACERDVRDGRVLGKLHGVPVAIKDNMLTANMPTTAGTVAAGAHFPLCDSAVATRLRAAGAILIGKTRTHEYAWGTETPPTRNPWDRSCIPGGSSGGSAAAVAAGLCAAAMGSDTGGSIRNPASFCGVVGLKPTFGRISRDGIVPHSWSLDHAGPLTRSVADAALLLGVLAGADPASLTEPVDDYVAATPRLRVGRHLRGRACLVGRISRRGATGRPGDGLHERRAQPGRDGAAGDWRRPVEGRAVPPRAGGRFRPPAGGRGRRHRVDRAGDGAARGQRRVEVAGGDESTLAATWRHTYPYNLTGMPAISLPCGFDEHGLPIGFQLAAKPFNETTLLRAAAAYERDHDWKDRRPDLDAPI